MDGLKLKNENGCLRLNKVINLDVELYIRNLKTKIFKY